MISTDQVHIARYDPSTGDIKSLATFPAYATIDPTVPYIVVPARDKAYFTSHKVMGGQLVERAPGDVPAGRPTPEAAYRIARREAYPPHGDQLDAMYKGGADWEEMKAKIAAVRARFPKPA